MVEKLTTQREGHDSNTGLDFSEGGFHVLVMPAWVFPMHSGFLPQSQNVLYRLNDVSKLP